MKKFIFLFLIFCIPEICHAWDSTAAKFYPLGIGNVWSYHKKVLGMQGNSCIMILSESDYIVRINSDSLMPNGKRYYKIQGPEYTYYERIDSLSMNVYRFIGGSDCLLDSLKAHITNTFTSCRSLIISPHQVQDTNNINIFGQNFRSRYIRGNISISHYYRLVEKIGWQFDRVCNFGGAEITMNGCIINGVQYGNIIGISGDGTEIPVTFYLHQNYPNPFNPTTKIRFDIPEFTIRNSQISIRIFNSLGQHIVTLVNENLSPGTYEINWDVSNMASGIYYYTLKVNENVYTRKMVLLK